MLGSLHPDLLACLEATSRSINEVRTSSSPRAGSLVTKISSTDRRTLAQATESRPLAGVHCPGQFVRQFRETYLEPMQGLQQGRASHDAVAHTGGSAFSRTRPTSLVVGLGQALQPTLRSPIAEGPPAFHTDNEHLLPVRLAMHQVFS
jgi:hypothetical protein